MHILALEVEFFSGLRARALGAAHHRHRLPRPRISARSGISVARPRSGDDGHNCKKAPVFYSYRCMHAHSSLLEYHSCDVTLFVPTHPRAQQGQDALWIRIRKNSRARQRPPLAFLHRSKFFTGHPNMRRDPCAATLLGRRISLGALLERTCP